MTKIWIAIFGIVAALLVIVFVLGTGPKDQSSVLAKIQTAGLPEHGIVLVGPAEIGFTNLISEQLKKTPDLDAAALKSSSVWVLNNSPQSIAAVDIRWELQQPDGK